MLKITSTREGSTVIAHISGNMDENTDFNGALGEQFGHLDLYCKNVTRINSVGIGIWIAYFKKLQDLGIKIALHECSTALVEQMNMIVNFSAGLDIQSFLAPYSCEKCESNTAVVFKTAELRRNNWEIPKEICPQCGGASVFDDVPSEYFSFIKSK